MKLHIYEHCPYCCRVLMIDGLTGTFREMKLPKRPDCPVCSHP